MLPDPKTMFQEPYLPQRVGGKGNRSWLWEEASGLAVCVFQEPFPKLREKEKAGHIGKHMAKKAL